MRKLKIIEHISLDGLIHHSADHGDFPYSDWTAPYRTPADLEATLVAYGQSFDPLLGPRSYRIANTRSSLRSIISVSINENQPTFARAVRDYLQD